jgi:AcrR family transcriptional regulator
MSLTDLPSARDRIVTTAYALFTRRGINAVGIDEVVEKAEVAKTTLYRHFPSKEDLVLAFLDRREELWTQGVIERGPRERSEDPEGQLLAVFDVMDDWFHHRSDYEACSFVKVLLEMGNDGRIGEACIDHLDKIRAILGARAERAGLRDANDLAWSLNILIKGSIICAAEGDVDAARRAKPIAAWIIDQHRSASTT